MIKYDKGIVAVATHNVKAYRTLTVHELMACVNTIVKKPIQ